MGVDGEYLATKAVHHHAPCGFGGYAREGREKVLDIVVWPICGGIEAQLPEAFHNHRERPLDPTRLLPGETGIHDQGRKLRLGDAKKRRRATKRTDPVPAARRVLAMGLAGERNPDKLLDWIASITEVG
jgi:hypothetical protein